jgi:hypothetical protein
MPVMRDPKEETQAYQATQSAWPIKILAASLLSATAYYAFHLYQENKYPWQRGHPMASAFERSER